MTRVFAEDGTAVPVTVLDVANNRVTQIKTPETDGYAAVQVTYGKRRPSRVAKPQAGHLAKAGVESGVMLKEFPVGTDALAGLKPGDVVGVDTFEPGQLVDVTGTTKGRGFSGVVRRHNFGGNRASHGNSVTTRAPGSGPTSSRASAAKASANSPTLSATERARSIRRARSGSFPLSRSWSWKSCSTSRCRVSALRQLD